jgi:CRISPR type I-E-associated protein CasB/Cse2
MTETELKTGSTREAARDWWRAVCGPDAADSGARARLRRARATSEVLAIPAGVRLARMLGAMPDDSGRRDLRFAAALDLARVLAHVTEDQQSHPMREVGWPSFPGSRRDATAEKPPRMSETRFRRLIQTESGEELVIQFKRLVALMGGTANVAALSRAFRSWDHPEGRVKQEWAFQYFNAGSAMQPVNDIPEDNQE